jgi:hypothetical protein
MWGRLRAVVVKELWAILRDPRARLILIMPPIVQLFVFGFASTLEVRNFDIGVYNRDGGGVEPGVGRAPFGQPKRAAHRPHRLGR